MGTIERVSKDRCSEILSLGCPLGQKWPALFAGHDPAELTFLF
jgi:hypothetical protein